MLSLTQIMNKRRADLNKVSTALDRWKKEWERVSPEVRKLRRQIKGKAKTNGRDRTHLQSDTLLRFLDWNHTCITSLRSGVTEVANSVMNDHRSSDKMVNALIDGAKNMLILPVLSVLGMLPKVVHDLARDQGKEVEFVFQGGEVEVDRRILEEMKDPLIHLLRNCVDHGIEEPEGRERRGKPLRGTVTLAVSRVRNKLEILISDDGAGIDTGKVREAAVARGILTGEKVDMLNERQAQSIIFQSEISTSSIISNISGRGLGLAITLEKVEKLGGTISIESETQVGTSFRILLPLAHGTIRCVLVRAVERAFLVPTGNLEQVLRIKLNEVKTIGNTETISWNSGTVRLVRLGDVLESTQKENLDERPKYILVLVLGVAGTRVAFIVDEILSEQRVLVKGLGKQLSRVRNVAAAAVLGSGQVVPILSVPDLLKSAGKISGGSAPAVVDLERKSILVVEDSITSRTLLKGILEGAGYRVKTAVDGVDAFAALAASDFDLVVSDIEMPRMNGFELVSKIRSDKRFSELPAVLVSARESRKDQKRGMEVGASAYIVKSSFEQSNLVEVVERFL